MRGFRKGAATLVVAGGALLLGAATARPAPPPSLGTGAPLGQMGVQLYDWSQYLSNGAGELVCPDPPAPPTTDCTGPPAPSNTQGRLERVFQYLKSKGIQNVELYGYPGNPFPGTNPSTPNNTAGLLALRALGDQYGLRFVSRHGNINENNWDNDIAASKILGQEVIGAADPPNVGSYQGVLQTAQLMNRLGKRSVEAGLGPVYFHNHAMEFSTKYMDNGVLKPLWEILMDRTDPRYVMAQVDLFWAAAGTSNDTNYLVNLQTRYANRIVSFHMKDGLNPVPNSGTSSLRALGTGDVNFAPIIAAAKNRVRYYLYEYDPVGIGQNDNFNPFTAADTSLKNLQGDPAPVLGWTQPAFNGVPAGTAAANNVTPVKVANIGDAPLVMSGSAPAIQANTDDGGNTTAGDFAVVSQDCSGKTLQPKETCTVNVGFKPSRTNYTSVARLVFNSNSDDAMERVPLVATSTGDATGTVGGNVPTVLSLSLPAQPGSFGTFQVGVAKAYETAYAATVTSTAGNATLSVSDPSTSFPGHLVNGSFALPSVLKARAQDSGNPSQAFAPLAEATGAATNLLTWNTPLTSDPLTIGFQQQIGAGDVLRAGSYSKTLTFTLSTTQP